MFQLSDNSSSVVLTPHTDATKIRKNRIESAYKVKLNSK